MWTSWSWEVSVQKYYFLFYLQINFVNVSLKPCPFSQSGTTALFFAAQQGHNDVVRFLFGFGASTECRTKVRKLRS